MVCGIYRRDLQSEMDVFGTVEARIYRTACARSSAESEPVVRGNLIWKTEPLRGVLSTVSSAP